MSSPEVSCVVERFDDPAAVDAVRTIPQLVAEARANGQGPRYAGLMRSSIGETTRSLVARGETTDDPLTQWILHAELRIRHVPPCLRWEPRHVSSQAAFIAFGADLRWAIQTCPWHQTYYTRWRNLFRYDATSERWHRLALWVYRSGKLGYYQANGLGLSERHMQPLATLRTNAMRGNRRLLDALPYYADLIHQHALVHRDRSGQHTPSNVAKRRAEILRLYLLAGRDATLAAAYHQQLHGVSISRQALTRHLEHVEAATRLRLLGSRSKESSCRPSVGKGKADRKPR